MHLLPAILVSGLCLSGVTNAHPSHHRRWRSRSDSVDGSSSVDNVERAFRDAFGRVSKVNDDVVVDAKLVARPFGTSGSLHFAPRSAMQTKSAGTYSMPDVVPAAYRSPAKHTSGNYASDNDKILTAGLHPHKIDALTTPKRPTTWHGPSGGSYGSKPPKSSTVPQWFLVPAKPSHASSSRGLSTYVASTPQIRKDR